MEEREKEKENHYIYKQRPHVKELEVLSCVVFYEIFFN